MTRSAPALRRSVVVVDAGPLKAAVDRDDEHHAWAVRVFRETPGRFVTCEAALAATLHLVENDPAAVAAIRRLCARMEVLPVAPERIAAVFAEVARWAPRMDFADACAVVLARGFRRSFVLTTDFRDFSTYRVPFASPEGVFAESPEAGRHSDLASARRTARRLQYPATNESGTAARQSDTEKRPLCPSTTQRTAPKAKFDSAARTAPSPTDARAPRW